jgi:hypothetical protein
LLNLDDVIPGVFRKLLERFAAGNGGLPSGHRHVLHLQAVELLRASSQVNLDRIPRPLFTTPALKKCSPAQVV